MKIPELLAPAGNFEKLKTAVYYGADAVYLGGKNYSLRAHATNFSDADFTEAIEYAHSHGVKVYVTINILAHNDDFNNLPAYLSFLEKVRVDGLIISDPGVLMAAKKFAPAIPIHLSTQANVTNTESARFWAQQGVRRINVARELTLSEIMAIKTATDAEIEVFVHGALCISYSGRCMLSLYLTGRDANKGDCAHPCRYFYRLEEEKRPGQFFPVEEDGRGSYIFNSKDLCLLGRLPDLINAGADSLKIEGRMKSVYYVGATVRLYRAALDYLAGGAGKRGESLPSSLPPEFFEELAKIGSRGYTENFIDGPPGVKDMLYESPRVRLDYAPVGIIREVSQSPIIEIRNPLKKGEQIEYLGLHNLNSTLYSVVEIFDQDGNALEQANPNSLVSLTTVPAVEGWEKHALLRKKM